MKLDFSPHFIRSYRKAPQPSSVRSTINPPSLLEDLHHPSLRSKKYGVRGDVWQARVPSLLP
jgi:hypothetical protein